MRDEEGVVFRYDIGDVDENKTFLYSIFNLNETCRNKFDCLV